MRLKNLEVAIGSVRQLWNKRERSQTVTVIANFASLKYKEANLVFVTPPPPRMGSGAVRIGQLRFLTGGIVKGIPNQGVDCFVS